MQEDADGVTAIGLKLIERCPHYSIKNERPGACKVATSQMEPDIIRETYFCKTNEYKSCLIYTGHKLSIFKKQKAV